MGTDNLNSNLSAHKESFPPPSYSVWALGDYGKHNAKLSPELPDSNNQSSVGQLHLAVFRDLKFE